MRMIYFGDLLLLIIIKALWAFSQLNHSEADLIERGKFRLFMWNL